MKKVTTMTETRMAEPQAATANYFNAKLARPLKQDALIFGCHITIFIPNVILTALLMIIVNWLSPIDSTNVLGLIIITSISITVVYWLIVILRYKLVAIIIGGGSILVRSKINTNKPHKLKVNDIIGARLATGWLSYVWNTGTVIIATKANGDIIVHDIANAARAVDLINKLARYK